MEIAPNGVFSVVPPVGGKFPLPGGEGRGGGSTVAGLRWLRALNPHPNPSPVGKGF